MNFEEVNTKIAVLPYIFGFNLTIYSVVLLLGLVNFIKFLLMEKRYKEWHLTMFYMLSFVSLGSRIF